MARSLRKWLFAFAGILLVGCDHSTKLVAEHHLGHSSVSLIPGFLDLQYTRNHDVAFTVLRALQHPVKPLLLITLSCLVLGGVLAFWWSQRRKLSGVAHVGLALIASGAIGNALDRLVRGYVVDFIHLHHWPVFNVADISITVGMGLLTCEAVRRKRSASTLPALND